MNYCVKHNEQCNSADASGHCSLTACNRYLIIKYEEERRMTIEEAIDELEERKAFLKRTCEHCWDDAIEQALQALKEKAERLV